MAISKTKHRIGRLSNSDEKSHRLFHLVPEDFPGLSFEYEVILPGQCHPVHG